MICENCGKEHIGKYASGRFCCEKCARAFSTKFLNKHKKKQAVCSKCGKNIEVSIYTDVSRVLCNNCKERKICNICGTEFFKKEKCPNNFCKNHNIQHFKSLIKYFGFDKSKLGTKDVEQEFNRVRNELYDLYWNKNLSSTQIAKIYNYKSTPTNITQKFFKNYLNIPVKSVKESIQENYLENRQPKQIINNQYKSGWHTTWNNKEVYLRSTYELDYAKQLDEQNIDYDCECFRIKYLNTKDNEYHCAVPDFYLKDTNTIVEIKSNWTFDVQEMKDKFKAYKEQGYNCKLILEHEEINLL